MTDSLQSLLEERSEKRDELNRLRNNRSTTLHTQHTNETSINFLSSKLTGLDARILAKARKEYPKKSDGDLMMDFDIGLPMASTPKKTPVRNNVVDNGDIQNHLEHSLLLSYIERTNRHMILDTIYKMSVIIIHKDDGSIIQPFIAHWNKDIFTCNLVVNDDHWLVYIKW